MQHIATLTLWLNAQSLQAAVQNSGFWLEGMLFRGQTVPNTDNKALLRRMIRGMGESESTAKSTLEKADRADLALKLSIRGPVALTNEVVGDCDIW